MKDTNDFEPQNFDGSSTTLSVLHITGDYAGSEVHKNLAKSLDNYSVIQRIYVPIRRKELYNVNKFDFKVKESSLAYSHKLNFYTRINYRSKIKRLTQDVTNKFDVTNIDIIHAHTWYSDGGVAYELHKRYKIPYIIAIRNTDINVFFKYLIHLRGYAKEILRNAERIIFLTPIYYKRLGNHKSLRGIKGVLERKSLVVPNGVDQFWIERTKGRKKLLDRGNIRLLFIGNFNKGKNAVGLVRAVEHLNSRRLNYHLHMVGGGGQCEDKVLSLIKDKPMFTFHGRVTNRETLEAIMRNCDIFTMPSHNETFGLVYVEALSQGLPIVYTKNEGIQGLYDQNIGEAVNSKDILSIADGIKKVSESYEFYNFKPIEIIKNHEWSSIAKIYLQLYATIIKRNI